MSKPVIAVTMGDPSGIGPEIIAAALAEEALYDTCRPVVFGDLAALKRGAQVAGGRLAVEPLKGALAAAKPGPGRILVREVSSLFPADMAYGSPSDAAGDAAFKAICAAAAACLSGEAAAMATAPISKEAMNRAGHRYPGHTELLAELCGRDEVVMMLAGDKLRVTLVTIHEALSRVPSLISVERVLATIRITHEALSRYVCPRPRLAVLALNPHCGEGGLFGTEQRDTIAPAVAAAQNLGIDAVGPLSADTLFHFAVSGAYDAVVCMYHDQGLIPLKLVHFEDGVNVTLGLPIIRTSVDHDTAYDLAGTGRASSASMRQALVMATGMALTAAGRRNA